MNSRFKDLPTPELVRALPATRYRAEAIDELAARQEREGFPDLWAYLESLIVPAQPSLRLVNEPTIGSELLEIANSGWNYSGMYDTDEALEFCTRPDNLEMRESTMTTQQRRFLGVLRKFYKRWKRLSA